ncbi:F-box domain containing protein [Parasponia andersonii]|uniref:F-box protein n=1 Tax=Parasponia andersonii TaxID=3476 RepID=A0A2P5A8H4_PARAD|nr:F-box domain containing protein [Parasponia andersonii]
MAKTLSQSDQTEEQQSPRLPPSWEVLVLVSQYLEPKTLAMASCVCKSWSVSMSSDHLWEPISRAHYPSLSNLRDLTAVPYCRLYAVAHAAALRRLQPPSKPRLSLDGLVFAVTVSAKKKNSSSLVDILTTVSKPVRDLAAGVDPTGVFKFDVEINGEKSTVAAAAEVEEVKVTWNVALKGWSGVFTMMDCEGKLRFSTGAEGWFSAELPAVEFRPGAGSGIVADLKMGFGRECVEKVSVGIMSVVNWRYVTVEDGLMYLQHFLVPL